LLLIPNPHDTPIAVGVAGFEYLEVHRTKKQSVE
jgi:hypothetical protein